jgi:hypothetical protein
VVPRNGGKLARAVAGVALAAAMTPSLAEAGDGTFPTEPAGSPVPAGNGPVSVDIGDFNADAHEDLVVANVNGDSVTVLLGRGDGNFRSAGDMLETGDGPRYASVGDFNEDGHDDLAVANSDDSNVAILLGTGNGRFGLPSLVPTPAGPMLPAVGDFNADSHQDLAIVNSSGSVAIRLGGGVGTFGGDPVGSPYPAGGNADGVAVGDFNADGKQDLATSAFGGQVTARFGAGDGTFATAAPGSPYAAGANPNDVSIGDFNNDGREDLAIPNANSGNVTIRLGGADGGFTSEAPASPFAVPQGPFAALVGSLNSDANQDLAITNFSGDKLTIRLGAGDGSFPVEPPGSPMVQDRAPEGGVIGDFNEDGIQDLAIANTGADNVTIRLGGGPPRLAGNLLTNGGFEGPGALRLFDAAPVAIPGWQSTGTMTFARYGIPTNAFFPDRFDSAQVEGGQSYLHPGNGAVAAASQVVAVADRTAQFDGVHAKVTLSAFLGGGSTFQDRMTASAEFLGAGGATLGTFEIGPVTNVDRNNLTRLLHRSATQPVPTGTEQIRVTLTARDDDANDNGATADNVKLTLAEVPADTIKVKGPKKKLRKSKAKFRFSSDDPAAAFECQLDRKEFKPCTSPAKAKRLKPRKHRFTVRAIGSDGVPDPSPAAFKFRVVRR